jgi:Ser/Thr protein kinase RdoA (MazF antagonist)
MSFPVHYSTLSADALLQLMISHYGMPAGTFITFLKRGFNDTYLLHTGTEKFILRVYKHGWRTLESIQTELTLLLHLKSNGISVSSPIPDKSNNLVHDIDAPEGMRHAVLFTFAEGEQARKLSKQQAHSLGAETAKLHELTKEKNFGEAAQNYSIEYQLDKTLRTVKAILKDHPAALDYLQKLQDDFLDTFRKADKNQLSKGICHGDLQAENFHVDGETFTFFDLDFFGNGYLAYDIGVFLWYDHKNKPKEITDAFLSGYQTVKKLTETELRLLPYFSTLRALFQMTLHCRISDGKQLPLWPAQQVADFIRKVEKWHTSAVKR